MPYVLNNSGVNLVDWGRGLGDTLSQALIQAPLQRQQQLMQMAQLIGQRNTQQQQAGFEQRRLGIEQQNANTQADSAKNRAGYDANLLSIRQSYQQDRMAFLKQQQEQNEALKQAQLEIAKLRAATEAKKADTSAKSEGLNESTKQVWLLPPGGKPYPESTSEYEKNSAPDLTGIRVGQALNEYNRRQNMLTNAPSGYGANGPIIGYVPGTNAAALSGTELPQGTNAPAISLIQAAHQEAIKAIRQKAPKDKVNQRLIQNGYPPLP